LALLLKTLEYLQAMASELKFVLVSGFESLHGGRKGRFQMQPGVQRVVHTAVAVHVANLFY
jgi:hypothetical protein